MLLEPFGYKVGNLLVVQLLEHEVAVAVDVNVRQINDLCVTTVLIILCGEVAAHLQHCLPEACGLNVLRTVLDVVAKEEQYWHLGIEELLVFC